MHQYRQGRRQTVCETWDKGLTLVRSSAFTRLYGWLILLGGGLYQMLHPIAMGDTDMWYHLSDGRYILTHGEFPRTAFFSFIDPPFELNSHWWLFQPALAKLYSVSGYYGLICLRATLFILIAYVLFRIFTFKLRQDSNRVFALVAFSVFLLIMEARADQVRPHLFSYLFILVFVYILEHKPRWAMVLPFLTVVWVNLHGIEWVVGALVVGGYFLEYAIRRSVGTLDPERSSRLYPVWLVGCALTMFVNPDGASLLVSPFVAAPDGTMFINELQSVSSSHFSVFSINLISPRDLTVVSIAFILVLFSFFQLLLAGRLRLPHVVMAVGGLILLGRGVRFFQEWACLSAPLVAHMAQTTTNRERGAARSPWSGMIALFSSIILIAPIHLFLTKHRPFDNYPLDWNGLPVGVSSFLIQTGAAGNVFATPVTGGYLQWALSPKLKIFNDMRMNSENFYAMTPSVSRHALRRMVDRYDIQYLMVSLSNPIIQDNLTSFDEFIPVFFDDVAILYANRKLVPEVADAHELKAVDPSNLLQGNGSLEERLAELRRVDAVYQKGRRVLHALTLLLFSEGRYNEAEVYARRFMDNYPANPNSAYLMGDIYENTEREEQAIEYYRVALRHASERFKGIVERHIGRCYYAMRDFDHAYDTFDSAINPYKYLEEPEDLYQYAYSAVVVGDLDRAERTLEQLLFYVDPGNTILIEDSRALLYEVRSGSLSAPGITDWLKSML